VNATRRERTILASIVAVGAIARIAYAYGATGMFYPDDLFQSLEPAHGVVYGTGIRFWEFEAGARPWTVPGVYAALFAALKLVGLTAAPAYTLAARLLDAAIAATWPYFAYRITRALDTRAAGAFGALFTATWFLFVLLAPRAFSHTFSVTFALWALARAAEEREDAPSRRSVLATGALLGLAYAFRYQEGLVALGLALYLVLRRRWRDVPLLAAGALVPALAVGALDWVTWGAPFHSLVAYFKENVGADRASSFGRMPWHFFATRAAALIGWGGLLIGVLPFASRRVLVFVATVGGTVLVIHSAVPHKEVRFVLTALVLFLCALGSGAAGALARLEKAQIAPLVRAVVAGGIVLLWVGASLDSAGSLTFARLSMYRGFPETNASPWTYRRDVDRAMMRVGSREDLCAVAILPFGRHAGSGRLATTGGYTHLNRAVPIVVGPPDDRLAPLVNYVISCVGPDGEDVVPQGLDPIASEGSCRIYRRPVPFACGSAEPFAYSWRW
jgi:hypothetical protein